MLYIILMQIFCFMSFCEWHYLLFIFILEYGNDVRQKANLSDFLI